MDGTSLQIRLVIQKSVRALLFFCFDPVHKRSAIYLYVRRMQMNDLPVVVPLYKYEGSASESPWIMQVKRHDRSFAEYLNFSICRFEIHIRWPGRLSAKFCREFFQAFERSRSVFSAVVGQHHISGTAVGHEGAWK